ncbi:PAS domain S-box protein [Halomonas sp. DQ26W]|uniref:PAS domain S-box protein n=1 Tax=Halomonas sp. DQ26W TaxID=2282311 RepID=UPI000DF79699|nr:PAS domain S-box protein [Halomonas sp. DQ26W]RDB42944.1 PAS domain S-box protein [Halomonas sp. DQ26W]
MPKTIDEFNVYTTLRGKAEAQLQAGTTPLSGHWSMGVDALRLLHQLSSTPGKAQDALKLLHELQVHQVELDLQNEAIAANEQTLVEDLGLYRALYDYAPIAYFVVDPGGAVVQGNLAAAELFDVGQDALPGQRIDTFINPENRPLLLGMLQRVAQNGVRDRCLAGAVGGAQVTLHLQFQASMFPGGEHILLACSPCAPVE